MAFHMLEKDYHKYIKQQIANANYEQRGRCKKYISKIPKEESTIT